MKTFSTSLIVALVVAGTLYSCKKKTDDPEPDPTTTTTTGTTGTTGSNPVNLVCDGKGTSTFYPLDSLNKWDYDYSIGGINQSSRPVPTVIGSRTYGTTKYAEVKDRFTSTYFRIDASNNNVYQYNDNNNTEYLWIPGAPTLNQTWPTSPNTSRKVTNLSASITTVKCTYTGLLEISELDVNSALMAKVYYKKGLGMVYTLGTGSFADKFSLSTVVLK